MTILPREYYQNKDVLFLSRDLLGKFLLTRCGPTVTGGMIVETEAYRGPEDRASHAFGNRRTKRNEVMYHIGGICYIYLCYGLHVLFNVVTNVEDIPHAILIRAIEPTEGIDEMLKRRKKTKLVRQLTSGPGALTQALGIQLAHNGFALNGKTIWIEDRKVNIPLENIEAIPRVGINYAKEDALLPWRFRIKDNPWTTR